MSLTKKEKQHHERLKEELQQGGKEKASNLEHLAAALLSHLLDVPIVVAKSGFQYGGDAGTAGQQGRRLRLECKKYSDTSNLNERELLGEIDQALERDEALEAWILVATRTVPEQLRQSLVQKGESVGVPIVIIDWANHGIAPLAALCVFAPDLVVEEFSKEAGEVARALQSISRQAIERLQRDLQFWCLGYDALRTLSHEDLDKIWNSPRESNAKLGQDAAGGAQERKIKRCTVHEALNKWWEGPARNDAPAAVVGMDGTGKTWATLYWLIDKRDEQPMVLIIPSSVVATIGNVSETSVKQLLADRLYEISEGIRDREHWLRRLENLLKRPTNEGPVLTVFFDGLNQEPSTPWLHILKILQGETFEGRLRVIVSTRAHYYEDRLSELCDLTISAERVDVDLYDTAPGSELDQMLEFENLTQADLHQDVIELARNPRLFKLVIRFREELIEADQVTVHRLLWEYGRDTFGIRGGRSLTQNEWRDWLKEIAQQHLNGIKEYSEKWLSETVYRPDLETKEVYARLSEIIDGPFATSDSSGLQITPAVVAHALGAALLNDLNQEASPTFETLNTRLAKWFDPILGLDEKAEILRAAVSILVEQGHATGSPIPGVLVTAWLQSQNVPHGHRQELADLAPNFPDALLDAIEYSDNYIYDSARFWAVNALRNIPKEDTVAFTKIINRSLHWMSIVSRNVDTQPNANEEHDKQRSDRLKNLIGIDSSQRIKVCGIELELVDHDTGFGAWQSTVPSIIEVFPLSKALPIFEVAAVSLEVRGQSECWDGLKWICLLNEDDPEDTMEALRNLYEEIRLRIPEPDIHPDLPMSVASLLLRLTGHNADEDKAVDIDPDLDRPFSYEQDYLPKPGQSWFPLERRHAEIVLADTELSLTYRVQRTKDLWLDPSFEPPDTFVAELRKAAEGIDVEKLERYMAITSEDYEFELLEPVLARCAPDLLADLIRRKLQNLSSCPPEFRQSRAILATNHLILAGEAEIEAVRKLRLISESDNKNADAHVTERLLLMEFQNLDAQAQFDLLLQSDLEDFSPDFCEVLRRPTQDDVDALVARYADGSPKQQHGLLTLLSKDRIELRDKAWSWFESFVKHQDHDLRRLAFRILTCADPMRFGQTLDAEGWSWSLDENIGVNHYGTSALIEATSDIPFDDLAPRLEPAQLLKAAHLRGAIPAEVRLAAEKFNPKFARENIRIEDFKPVLEYAMDIVERWLDDYFGPMENFQHRGPLTNRAFWALFEALLTYFPEKGKLLWHKLRSTMITQYIGEEDVKNLMHIVFRVPDSPEVMALREELVGLEYCHNDQKLFELAIAASSNRQSYWLDTVEKKDRESPLIWHRRRAEVLAGFTVNNSLPVAGAWPDGEIRTTHAKVTLVSEHHRWIEACAHHWWRTFLNACDPAEAYAAWVLFLHSADRRAWMWMSQDIETADNSTDLFQRKINHVRLNQSKIEQAMKKREGNFGDKLDQHFLYRKTVRSVGPWFGR